jgi:hypothetical protein
MAVQGDGEVAASLSAWESWCVTHLRISYNQALTLKCPFLKRRASDVLDAADQVMRFLMVRHKSLDLLGPPPSWRCDGDTKEKARDLPLETLLEVIRKDWKVQGLGKTQHKGYYITGRLNTAIYRDDCLFDGPDPDMPVRGLRKYLNAASQLFDQRQSEAELTSLEVVNDNLIVARWRIHGVLMLPWRPQVPEWTGSTRYHRDGDGLIYCHEEDWDISVFRAFLGTLLPSVANQIWKE